MTKIIKLEGPVSDIHLSDDEKDRQNKKEEVPDVLEFNLDGHMVHFVQNDKTPLKDGDQCIVAGYLHEDIIQALALKHLETGNMASADTDTMKRDSSVGIVACRLGIIISLILLSIVGFSGLILFAAFTLLLITATIGLVVIKKFVFDEAALIEEARNKV